MSAGFGTKWWNLQGEWHWALECLFCLICLIWMELHVLKWSFKNGMVVVIFCDEYVW